MRSAMRGTVRTESFDMEYCCFGQGKNTLVILPGLSVRSVSPLEAAISSAFSEIAVDHTVFLFDRRKECPENYDIQAMAEDTYQAIKYLDLQNVNLYGASQGGMIAQAIAVHYPEFIRSLIVCSSSSRPNATSDEVFEKWIRFAKKGDIGSLNASMTELIYSHEYAEKYGEVLRQMNNGLNAEELNRFVILACAAKAFDLYDSLDRICCNTLVIGSRGDRVLTAEASEEMATRIGCDIYMYEERYGHAVYDEAPDLITRIRDFLVIHHN